MTDAGGLVRSYKGHRIAMHWNELQSVHSARRFHASFVISFPGEAPEVGPKAEHIFDTARNAGDNAFSIARRTIDAKLLR